jgi:predicted dehydrogenase
MRVVVVGEGFGGRVVAPTYRQLGCEVVIVSPRDANSVERAIAGQADLISIHSPPLLHFAHVMLALDQGRAVLCDKPFGHNASEAIAMRDRARDTGALTFLNFEFRYEPARLKLKALLDEGAIGALQHVSWTFIGSGLRGQAHRWLFDERLGGGWIGAYGSHAIDALCWLTGGQVADCGGLARIETPLRPDASGVARPSTAEDAFSSWFLMTNGCSASFDTAFSASANLPQRIILMGSMGAMELVDDQTIHVRRPGMPDEVITFFAAMEGPPPALHAWLAEVCAAVAAGRQVAPTFDDGVIVAEAMQRLRSNLVRPRPA